MTTKRLMRPWLGPLAIAGLSAAFLDPHPVYATGGSLLLRIVEARADFEAGLLVVRGQNLVRTTADEVYVSLSSEPLALISKTPQEIVAHPACGRHGRDARSDWPAGSAR
jgi:hypothetical protein